MKQTLHQGKYRKKCELSPGNNRGVALIFALIAIIIILGALTLTLTRVQVGHRETNEAYNRIVLEEAAQAGIDFAVNLLWDEYIANNETTGNWGSYRYYLNNELNLPINEDLNFSGERDPNELGDGRGGFKMYPQGYDRRGMTLIDEPMLFTDPNSQRTVATIETIHVARYDTIDQARLTVRATASHEGRSMTAVQLLNIGGASLDHGQFAILANNISCALCHAQIHSLDMERNNDPSLYGTFDRVKIASLESIMVRRNENINSNLAGTLYTRGSVYDEWGNEYTANTLANTQFRGFQINDVNGKLIQNSQGNMTSTPLKNAGLNPDGELTPHANLYLNYPTDPQLQSDGPLPTDFPAPYPDENNNRRVDDEEFEMIVRTANGRIDFLYGEDTDSSGSISSGVAYGVSSGQIYTGNSLPTSSGGDALSQLAEGSHDGNLILVGTPQDPIRIDGTVAIDGDLVLSGPIQGAGQLLVRGNTYVVGDVTYADDPGEFGKYDVQPDGSYKENAFALISGGSIIMGDYLTVRGVNPVSQNNAKYPSWSQYSIDVRTKNRSNTVSGQVLPWGYFDQWSVDSGEVVAGRPGQQFSFTTSELKLFNNLELEKALADPNYTPRFYGLRESQPNNIYVYDSGDEHAVRYTETGVKLLSDYILEHGLDPGILERAVFHYTSPTANWISEDTLRQIWYNDEMTRPSSGRPFMFDGLLYSNNAIFNIVRSRTRHNSNTRGQLRLRGGVIAPDLGVFVPEGLFIYYDPRVERFIEFHDSNVVTFNRVAFYLESGDGYLGEV